MCDRQYSLCAPLATSMRLACLSEIANANSGTSRLLRRSTERDAPGEIMFSIVIAVDLLAIAGSACRAIVLHERFAILQRDYATCEKNESVTCGRFDQRLK